MECTLVEVRLGRAAGPGYEALSYVWSSPSTRRNITLDGLPFPVTANLEAALRQLRRKDSGPRAMWIGGLCIDQSNVEERSQQVRNMDCIYSNVSSVVVWLGPETQLSSCLFQSLDATRDITRGSRTA